jgi:translation initiation factor eIF-2B subunit beta
VIEEVELTIESVTAQAKEHINDNDLILTYSISNTLISLFKEASKTSRFEVIVPESAPTFEGHKTVR